MDTQRWRFTQRRRNGKEIWGVQLYNFLQDFQKIIDEGTIIPGWHKNANFIQGQASHISVVGLSSVHPPGSLKRALDPSHPDHNIWFESYKEEFDGLTANSTFEILTEAQYFYLCKAIGCVAIPSMCVFTIKKDSRGHPVRAKSRIVLLGNKDPTEWTKADCYAPVVSLPVVRLLTALAVKNKCTLKQGDCKNAFVQADLPPVEATIVRPPVGCPFSPKGSFWKLKKSLYGLRRAPRHWYALISSIFEAEEIGLKKCKHDPCLFAGTPLPGKPPLYAVLYVDDFVYFSHDTDVEHYFESALAAKVQVDFLGDAEWFIGLKFDWSISDEGQVDCRVSQETYAHVIAEAMRITECSVSPRMTPFRSGFPVDAIPPQEMLEETRAPLIAEMRSWCGMLNWLSLGTRPDISAICSILASFQCKPVQGHLEAARYVGKYIMATANLGLHFSSRRNEKLEAFVFFPPQDSLLGFCDANWGPQEASRPTSANVREVSMAETRSICGHILYLGGAPIFWKSHKESRTSCSSCKAEIKAMNGCAKHRKRNAIN